MKLYNQNTDKIENYNSIEVAPLETKVVAHLTEVQLNSYGYFHVEYGERPNSLYYTNVESGSIIANKYQIVYTSIELPLQTVKDNVIAKIMQDTKMALDEAVAKYSAGEMASWTSLEEQAIAFLGGELITNCPMLKDEADACSQDYATLANEIVANANGLRALRTAKVAERYNKTKAIQNATTIAEIEAVTTI